MVRPLNAAIESSTNPDSFSVSVWIVTCTSYSSATPRQQSIAAGGVPQSSCNLSPTAPATIWSARPAGGGGVPLPGKAKVSGSAALPRGNKRAGVAPGARGGGQGP